jgi:hypothetical protein
MCATRSMIPNVADFSDKIMRRIKTLSEIVLQSERFRTRG